MWKEMSADEKAPFEAKAKEDKERFKQETEDYNAKRRPDRYLCVCTCVYVFVYVCILFELHYFIGRYSDI